MKTVRICTLVRNREWIIPLYLEHLSALEYDKKLITIHWLVNNSTDSSLSLLQVFKEQNKSKYNKIIIEIIDKKNLPEDIRSKNTRFLGGIHEHLANMRNYLFNKCKEDYLFNIDSDILAKPNVLQKLIKHNKDMVSAWIYNGYEFSQQHNVKYWDYTNLCLEHMLNFKDLKRAGHKNLRRIDINRYLREGQKLIEVDLAGAIALYSKNLYKNRKIRFYGHIDGEDHPYCILAKENGFKIYADITSYNQHIMNKYWFEKYKNGDNLT